MNKKISLLLSILMIMNLLILANVAYAQEEASLITNNSIDHTLIDNYFDSINNKDYNSLLSLMGNEYSTEMSFYLDSNYYQENHLGVYCIDTINSVSIVGEIDNSNYLPIIGECEGDDIHIYLVCSDITTEATNQFYFNGTNYNLFFIGTVNGERKIVAFRMPLPETIEKYIGTEKTVEYNNTRSGTNSSVYATSCSYNSLPSTIKVARWKYGSGSIETVDLLKYVKTVACAELGFVTRDEDYHYSGALAIRNYSWYKILTADSNAQYHVTDTNETNSTYKKSYQVYNPSTFWNNSTWQTLYTRVDSIWSVNFFATNYNRIDSWYTTASGVGGENSGRMNLNTANTLANSGNDYKKILNYFYGNSSQSTGSLNFCTVGSHVYYRTVTSGSTATRYCKCGHTVTVYIN